MMQTTHGPRYFAFDVLCVRFERGRHLLGLLLDLTLDLLAFPSEPRP